MIKLRHSDIRGLRIRAVLGDGLIIGPGQADLLAGIHEAGSIAAAARRMGMSYKRAWQLVGILNTTFREPLITKVKGGSSGGGAQLTPLGNAVLDAYRRLEAKASAAGAEPFAALRAALKA